MTDWQPTRLSTGSWAIYDLANTIFALGVSALYFPDWLTESVDGIPALLARNDAPDLALAVAVDLAMIVVILFAPWLGAVADHTGRRVRLLVPTTLLAVIPTFFLASTGVVASLGLFVVALIGFNLGSVVYDAMLPDVSTPANRGTVSGLGVGVGYLGSFVAVGVGALLLDRGGHSQVFQVIGVLFLLFSIPTFLFVKERPAGHGVGRAPGLRSSVRQLVVSWRRARQYDGVARFLVARFFYTDAINTLIGGFLTIYVIEELAFESSDVERLLALAILTAILGGIVGGRLVDRWGPRRVLHLAIHGWMVAMAAGIVAGAFVLTPLIWALAGLGGLALGTTWAADRVYMAAIAPPRHLGEFYGLYATVGRFATIVGPLVWGTVVGVFGLPREVALGALLTFLVIGRVLLNGVDDRPRTWAGEMSA